MRAIFLKGLAVSFIVGAVIVAASQIPIRVGQDSPGSRGRRKKTKARACARVDREEIEPLPGCALLNCQAEDQSTCELSDKANPWFT
jgi:hypothetical protein